MVPPPAAATTTAPPPPPPRLRLPPRATAAHRHGRLCFAVRAAVLGGGQSTDVAVETRLRPGQRLISASA